MRWQHLFTLLTIGLVISQIWIPIWNFELGIPDMPEETRKISLKSTSLHVSEVKVSASLIPDFSYSYYFFNTIGEALFLFVLVMSFISTRHLSIQRKWAWLAFIASLLTLLFTYLQIRLLLSDFAGLFPSKISQIGQTLTGSLYILSEPNVAGLCLKTAAIIFTVLMIFFINRDQKLVDSMSRLR